MPRHTRARGFTRTELLTVVGLLAVLCVALTLLTRPSFAREDATIDHLTDPLVQAVSAWKSNHPGECPTLGQIAAQGFLEPEARRDDPWGGSFRVACDGKELSLLSPGPDGTLGTKDDVRVDVR